MKKSAILLLLLPVFASAQNIGLPQAKELVEHTAYMLSYNEEHEQAEWVYYHLTKEEAQGNHERTDDFRPDPAVSTGSAVQNDYGGSGFDRGHLAPAGDMAWSEAVMSESFFFSNMSPQHRSLNRGKWRSLETKVRNWAVAFEAVHVFTGPFLVSGLDKIGANEVSVPNAYYKVVVDLHGSEHKGIAFIMENRKIEEKLEERAVSIDSIETLTGFDFFNGLPDALEERLESEIDVAKWGF